MPFAPVSQGRLYYREFGEGEPLLLIPGLGGVGSFWRRQVDSLAAHYRVILHDHRGTGRSSTETAAYSVELMAEDAFALMAHLGIEHASIVGHSTGGVIAQTMAVRAPERVGDLVLSASWAHGDPYFRALFELRLEVLKAAGMAAYERLGRLLRYPPWYFEENPGALNPGEVGESGTVEVVSSRIGALLAFDSRDFLARIAARTLIIGAADDAVTPSYLWKELAAGIPGAQRVTLPTGGHFCPQTQAEVYNEQLLAFLGGRPLPAIAPAIASGHAEQRTSSPLAKA